MDTFSQIVPIRFRIDEAYLRNLAISFSNFAYEQDCQNFLESMKRLSPHNHPETPPYRRLNTVLTALAPTLAHPFIACRNVDTWQSERQMLVVGADVMHRPQPEQMSDLLYEWANQWGQNSFAKEISGAGKDAHQRLLDRLQEPAQQWQETDAASLFLNLDAGTRAGYRAIPSVLASLLAGQTSPINGKSITWRLAQDGDAGLAVISNPFQAEFEEENYNTHVKEIKTGTFAYKLEFRLQTQVGSPHRWLHLYVRCSRYVDGHLRNANWNRDVSVKVGANQPRLSGWSWSPTLVTLPLTGGLTNPHWQNDPAQLLSAMKARDLVAPNLLLQTPKDYRIASPHSMYDEYFVLHAEGFKPAHQVKTGFDFAELREVASSVSELLGIELSAGQTLVSDIPTRQMYRPQLPLMMYSMEDLREKKFVKKQPQLSDEERERQNRLQRQKIILNALQRASNHQRLYIILCCSDSRSKTILEQEIRQVLFMEKDEPWPEHIEVITPPTLVPGTLLAPLDPGKLNPHDHYEKFPSRTDRQKFQGEWKAQMRRAFREKTRAWESYLNSLFPSGSGYGLALIELHELDHKKNYADQHIKGAVRRACNKLGLASQMIFPVKLGKDDIAKESQYRVRNSVTDLVYRQTGLVYDRPVDLYMKAGIPQEQAEHLHVIALFKLRKNEPKMNYPMAVCLYPDGTFQALLPSHSRQWLPLLEAREELGKLFIQGKAQDIHLPPDVQAQFAAQVFTETRADPTLVLLEAQDWRNYNVLPQFANGRAPMKNQLDLGHVKVLERLYGQEDLPNLRIIRIRTLNSGETPQYFAVHRDEDDDMKEDKDLGHLTGFIDIQAESDFFHYLSVGRLPTTAAREQRVKPGLYKMDQGGGIAFKHQTIVEFVPFFLQKEDDPQAWCHIPHFLRVSPAWDGGNIVLPYPMHLAKCMIEDQLCILDSGLNEEEA